MATYFVTASETATWDNDPETHFKSRQEANVRAAELLAIHPQVRIVRWENDQPVKEDRITSAADLQAS